MRYIIYIISIILYIIIIIFKKLVLIDFIRLLKIEWKEFAKNSIKQLISRPDGQILIFMDNLFIHLIKIALIRLSHWNITFFSRYFLKKIYFFWNKIFRIWIDKKFLFVSRYTAELWSYNFMSIYIRLYILLLHIERTFSHILIKKKYLLYKSANWIGYFIISYAKNSNINLYWTLYNMWYAIYYGSMQIYLYHILRLFLCLLPCVIFKKLNFLRDVLPRFCLKSLFIKYHHQ